jgi:hypothetical protein
MKKLLVVVALVALGLGSVTAQTATPHATKRQLKQQARIKEGVKSGELTPGETRRLERQQAKIQHDKKVAKSDGTVTPAERAKIAHEQNRASRRIYRLKHNDKEAK